MSQPAELPPGGTIHYDGSQRLSKMFWGIDWNEHLPKPAGTSGIDFHVGDWDRVQNFMAMHAHQFVEVGGAQLRDCIRDAKLRHLRHFSDHFEFRLGHLTVGAALGNPEDWSTYYFRSS